MAISESIKRRLRLLEDECARADNLARCLAQLTVDNEGKTHPLVYQFEDTVDRVNQRVNSLVKAIHRGGRHGKNRR